MAVHYDYDPQVPLHRPRVSMVHRRSTAHAATATRRPRRLSWPRAALVTEPPTNFKRIRAAHIVQRVAIEESDSPCGHADAAASPWRLRMASALDHEPPRAVMGIHLKK